jgi:class 3 adenylate cyclase
MRGDIFGGPFLSMSDQDTKSERRLAAIMVTDIAGYSSLMQSD